MTKQLNVVLLGNHFVSWGGGIDFLRLCANSLSIVDEKQKLQLFLLIEEDESLKRKIKNNIKKIITFFLGLPKLKKKGLELTEVRSKDSISDSFSHIDNLNLSIIYYKKGNKELIRTLNDIKADVIIPSMKSLGEDFPVPWVGYIYDFQHKYFPDFFTEKECKRRDEEFSRILSESKAIIVNSNSVKEDINKFFPNQNCKIFNLPYAPSPIESWFIDEKDKVIKKYNLPQKYFAISNQFWVHKSHMTAFEALIKLTKDYHFNDYYIVCTGKTEDYRFPNYFKNLKDKLEEMGLQERIKFLGVIPKQDQINILRNSIAVIQPTLFEGGPGGGSVYDAVSMGVPVIVSDIPVNLEIEEQNVYFFEKQNSNDLAAKMANTIQMNFEQPDQSTLIKLGIQRRKNCGDRLLQAINYTIKNCPKYGEKNV